jgi:hypothetical protein
MKIKPKAINDYSNIIHKVDTGDLSCLTEDHKIDQEVPLPYVT